MQPGSELNLPDATFAEDQALSLKPLLQTILKRLWIILLSMVVFTGVAVGTSLTQTPQYEASTKILVGREGGITENPGDVLGLQQLTLTMAEAAYSRPIAEAAIQQANLDVAPQEILDSMIVEPIPETQFVQVSYTGPNAEKAKRIVNAFGSVFSEKITRVGPSAGAITATVWEPAITPNAPVSPDPTRNGIFALFAGAVVGTALAFLLEHLDDSWQSPEEAEQVSGAPTFAVIPEFRAQDSKGKRGG